MLITYIIIIILSSVIIYFAGNKFAIASTNIGDYLRLPKSVKGATFDAISSSFPELMIALFSIIFFKEFELGIGTITGSALFNLLIIPAICVFVAPMVFKVNKSLVSRDAIFYLMAVFLLLVIVLFFTSWNIWIAILFLIFYIWYGVDLYRATKRHRQELPKKSEVKKIKINKEVLTFVISLLVIAVSAYFLTEAAVNMSKLLGISSIIIGFTVLAAATSVPDAVISIANAKKGNLDDATSNVFGSNVFDIFVGLSIPVIVAIILNVPTEIHFNNLEIVLGLLGSTILVIYFLAQNYILSKKHAIIMLVLYFIFVLYIVLLSLSII